MKRRFIDIFDYEGNKELLKYRLIKMENIVDLFVICDNSNDTDVEYFISNNLNSFKEKILVLKNFNYRKNLSSMEQILSELKLDYEDILSFSDSKSLPYIDNPNFYKTLYFGTYILKSKVIDINEIDLGGELELGSLMMFYHNFNKTKSDIPKIFEHISKNEINLSLFLHIELGLKVSDTPIVKTVQNNKFVFNFN